MHPKAQLRFWFKIHNALFDHSLHSGSALFRWLKYESILYQGYRKEHSKEENTVRVRI